jgi:hypothetical protein
MKDKEKQEISVLGRLFCLEALLLLMGVFSLVSGVLTGTLTQLFWGVAIIAGAVILHFVKKRDWKAHFEELEREKQADDERRRQNREKTDGH